MADVLDHGEVVGDEQVGQTVLGLEVHQQVYDLGLDGNIQSGDGFVGDDEAWA